MTDFVVGMRLNTEQITNSPKLQLLIDEKLIELKRRIVISCDKINSFSPFESDEGCGNSNILYKEVESLNCKFCGQDINLSNSSNYEEMEISNVDYEKIIEICVSKLGGFPEVTMTKISFGNYIISTPNNEGALVFNYINMNRSAMLGLISNSEYFILINIDGSREGLVSDGYCSKYDIYKFLNIPEDNIINEIKYLPKESIVRELMERIEKIHEKLKELSTEVSWQDFEGEIVDFLIKKIRSKSQKLVEYLYLTRYHPSFSYIHVQVGGAGNTDYRPLDLEDYLQVFFDRNLIIDAKKFSTSEINNGVLEKVEHHVNNDPSDPNRVLIITTKDKVTCWNEIQHWKNATGFYKVIVVTPAILAHILCYFEIDKEVFTFLNSLV